MVVSLDLLSGIVQALKNSADSLVASAQPSIVQLLTYCVKVGLTSVDLSPFDVYVKGFLPRRAPELIRIGRRLGDWMLPALETVSPCDASGDN